MPEITGDNMPSLINQQSLMDEYILFIEKETFPFPFDFIKGAIIHKKK